MSQESANRVVELVADLLRRAISAGASDVHFEPGDDCLRVRFRIDGVLRDVETLPAVVTPNVVARLKVLSGLLTYRTDVPQEGSIAPGSGGFGCDIRVATFPTVRGERVVLRLLAQVHRLMTLDELGFDAALVERLRQCMAGSQGLFLVCGPAGSGKTTTLYALLHYLLEARAGLSIFAIEDPVEIRLDGITQVEIRPARGLSYPVALRSLLRQDPQVLMIGEVRDAETARVVVEAALTGHLLLSTMHSGTPAEAIVRLREMGIPAYQLTSTLTGVLAQRLVRKCAGGEPAAGFSGRTAIGHLVVLDSALRRAILDEVDTAALADAASGSGSLRADAERLLRDGLTTAEEVRRVLGA